MWSREKINASLLKHYRIFLTFFIIGVLVLSILLPYNRFTSSKGNFENEVNPTIVNGILTATAIVFGFVAFELREIKSSIIEKFVLSLPLLFYLMITLEWYFIAATVGKITMVLVFEITSNCLFNILYTIPLTIAKEIHEELEQRKQEK